MSGINNATRRGAMIDKYSAATLTQSVCEIPFLDLLSQGALPKRLTRRAVELKDIEAIIDLMRKNDLSVFEMEKEGFKLKLQRGPDGQPLLTTPIALAPSLAGATSPGPETAPTPQPRADTARLKEIVSPMVGTFYRAASPDAP